MLTAYGLARLGRDCEIRYTPDGTAVANISLAFNYGRKGEDGKRPSQWVDGALFGKLAEALAPYLLKGTSAVVSMDDLHVETFDKRDGGQGTKLVARISTIELAIVPKDGAAPVPAARTAAPAPAPAPSRAPAPAPQRQGSAPVPSTGWDDMDSDIPFAASLNDYAVARPKSRRLSRSNF